MKINNEIARLSFVGDILPSNMPYTECIGNYDKIDITIIDETYDKPDIFFANLESPILFESNNNIPFSGNPKIINLFKKVGLNIVSISNNHILEYGEKGFNETIKILREQNIKVVGIQEDNTSNIEFFNIKNQLIAFAGFNSIHDLINPSLYAELNIYSIDQALQKMRNINATFKIFSIHWGNEYMKFPNPDQIKFAKYAIENGCDLIIGHHPHIIQKIERMNNKYIFYSLGNAFFDFLFCNNVKKGLRVDCELTKNNITVKYYFISTINFGFEKINGNVKSLALSINEIYKQNLISYKSWHNRNTKIIRAIHRFKMKLFIFEMFIKLPFSKKYQLLKNIKNLLNLKIKKNVHK